MSTVAPDTTLKRRRPAHHPVAQGQDKKRKKEQCVAKAAAAALLEVRHVGIPLVCKATGRPCESVRLEAGRLYAIGRGAGRCDFLLPDPRVSNLHCRILFDGSQRKVFVFHAGSRPNDSFVSREKFREEREAAPCGSLSRVFVNGVECRQGSAVALFAGDEVLLVCGGYGKCRAGIRIGFAIGRIVVLDEEEVVSPCSDDPCAVKERFSLPWTTTTTTTTSSSSKRVSASRSTATSPGPSSSSAVYRRAKSLLARCRHILHSADPVSCIRRCPIFLATAMPASLNCNNSSGSRLNLFSKEPATDPGGEPELPNVLPINNSDTICNLPSMRFLSYCRIPDHLPVTIACHNTDRCWSSSPEQRTLVPYPEFPKLVVVYPPFPGIIAFACHHPKLLVFQREDRIRVIITSANLVAK